MSKVNKNNDEYIGNEVVSMCQFCECDTSKILIWAGGARAMNVCGEHIQLGVHTIIAVNRDTIKTVVDLMPMPDSPPMVPEEVKDEKIVSPQVININIVGKPVGGEESFAQMIVDSIQKARNVIKKEKKMPYATNDALPDSVKNVLPAAGQTVFRTVANSQLDAGLSEERAFASAWGALKNQGWKKQDNGKWMKVQKSATFEHETNILKRDDELQLVTGVVMEPEEVDAHGDVVSEEEIRQAAHDFMRVSRVMGLQHKQKAPVEVVESFIAHTEMNIGDEVVKKGSWVMTAKVHDLAIWEQVKLGEYTGFSIGGTAVKD